MKQYLASKNDSAGALDMLYVVLVYTLLEDKGFRFNNPCVGVLLAPNLVLSTLSCLQVSVHGAIDTDLIFVYLMNSEILRLERVFVYPDMKEGPNVALMLCESSQLTVFPKLPEKEFKIKDFEFCTLCGFGADNGTIKLEHFTAVRMNRSEIQVCSKVGREMKWMCLHFTRMMPCRGDVGAPLICNGAVHAIFNPPVQPWGPPSCVDTYGATFTSLHSLVPWIKKVNSSLEIPVLSVLNTPGYWICAGVTALTIIVVIYYGIMRFVDWKCSKDEEELAQETDGPRVIYVRSTSQMSMVSSRWLRPP